MSVSWLMNHQVRFKFMNENAGLLEDDVEKSKRGVVSNVLWT